VAGQNPPLGRKRFRDSAQRIKAIVEDFNNRPILEYLRGIEHNLNLQVYKSVELSEWTISLLHNMSSAFYIHVG